MRSPRIYLGGSLLVAAVLIFGTAAGRAQDAKLEGAAAWQKLVGNTAVVTTKGGSYTEFYEPGGDLRRTDADGATKGQWAQDGEQVCFDYPDDDDHVCLRVTVQGSSGSFHRPRRYGGYVPDPARQRQDALNDAQYASGRAPPPRKASHCFALPKKALRSTLAWMPGTRPSD